MITQINEQNISKIIHSFPKDLQPSKIQNILQDQFNEAQDNVSVEKAIEFSYLLEQLALTTHQIFVL